MKNEEGKCGPAEWNGSMVIKSCAVREHKHYLTLLQTQKFVVNGT